MFVHITSSYCASSLWVHHHSSSLYIHACVQICANLKTILIWTLSFWSIWGLRIVPDSQSLYICQRNKNVNAHKHVLTYWRIGGLLDLYSLWEINKPQITPEQAIPDTERDWRRVWFTAPAAPVILRLVTDNWDLMPRACFARFQTASLQAVNRDSNIDHQSIPPAIARVAFIWYTPIICVSSLATISIQWMRKGKYTVFCVSCCCSLGALMWSADTHICAHMYIHTAQCGSREAVRWLT